MNQMPVKEACARRGEYVRTADTTVDGELDGHSRAYVFIAALLVELQRRFAAFRGCRMRFTCS
jgi:hypothetical protein